ncbi:hypothetical protein C8J56DRAFT_1167569 [Mycena floridula]|nr:hypothetical protein C8J56DRAFT_1167569 [Mycena floridula]
MSQKMVISIRDGTFENIQGGVGSNNISDGSQSIDISCHSIRAGNVGGGIGSNNHARSPETQRPEPAQRPKVDLTRVMYIFAFVVVIIGAKRLISW